MNINPTLDPPSSLKPATEPPRTDPAAVGPSPEQAMFQSDRVQLSPTAETAARNQSIETDTEAAEAALAAAQQIQTGSPDVLYDWSAMTPERLKELLG